MCFTLSKLYVRFSFISSPPLLPLPSSGADPWRVVESLRKKLGIHCLVLQIPIGTEATHYGVIDLVTEEAVYFEGNNGETVHRTKDIPPNQAEMAKKKRVEMLESLVDLDDEFGERYLEAMEAEEGGAGGGVSVEEIKAAVRRVCIGRKAMPVLMGSAFKNKGVQPLLDAVLDYLPSPLEVTNHALDLNNEEKLTPLTPVDTLPFVGFAFKLEESQYGQLTYLRVYQGTLRRGEFIYNQKTKQRVKVQRLVRMHSSEMEEVDMVYPGDIGAIFGIDCSSGDTFTDGKVALSCLSMHVPSPVISLAVKPESSKQLPAFSKALNRFQREDPTFRMYTDTESNETIIAGMGELHLDIYVQRMEREYGVKCTVSRPRVRYRETLRDAVSFDYTLKKQTGGAGQYARIVGELVPMDLDEDVDESDAADTVVFESQLVGEAIPPAYVPAIEKGFLEATQKGPLVDQTVLGVKMILKDGASHEVDSSDFAFRNCARLAFRDAFMKGRPIILQPIMKAEVTVPSEYQGEIISQLTRRKSVILDTDTSGGMTTLTCEVPLNKMFGYSMDLRSATEGKGEFVMEFLKYMPVSHEEMETIKREYQEYKAQQLKEK